ncbi:hypothetical protein [Photorhabdus asymbiotica]
MNTATLKVRLSEELQKSTMFLMLQRRQLSMNWKVVAVQVQIP